MYTVSYHFHICVCDIMMFIILGTIILYFLVQLMVLWIFQTVVTFWRLVFPYHSKYWERRGIMKYIHIAAVVSCLVLPAVTPITTFSTGGYISVDYIPPMCTPISIPAFHFSLLLPSSLILATGSSLICIYTWILIKVSISQLSIRQIESNACQLCCRP